MSTHKDWTLLVWGDHIQGHPEDAAHNIVCGPHCALVASIPLGSSASTHDEPGETVITEAEALEHARLMSAAPDLLAAAKKARAALSELLMTRDPIVYSDALKALDEAIQKAGDQA